MSELCLTFAPLLAVLGENQCVCLSAWSTGTLNGMEPSLMSLGVMLQVFFMLCKAQSECPLSKSFEHLEFT